MRLSLARALTAAFVFARRRWPQNRSATLPRAGSPEC
jgi:hypothetical protein